MESRLAWLTVGLVCAVAGGAHARADTPFNAQNHLVSASQLQSVDQFQVCIDESDCKGLGANYACFQYICYPYEDDSMVRVENRKTKCSRKEECGPGQVCFRHHDVRKIMFGLCMDELGDCRDNGERDCKGLGPDKCCNGKFCCESKYFDQLKQLPCVNHLMCKDLGYGDYCCPQKGDNSTRVCCNENPNPPTTTLAPKVDSLSAASNQCTLPAGLIISLAVLLLSAIRIL